MKHKRIVLILILAVLFLVHGNSLSLGWTANLSSSKQGETSFFEIHFIDVGQGDCALILCDGKAMLIDGGEASQSSKVYAYLKEHGVDHLNYIVASHAHADHVGGLSGALNYATVDVALCPVLDYDTKTFQSFVKYLGQQNVSITIPNAGDTFELGSATIQILAPFRDYEDPNDTSIVMKVVYGETSFLFTGDATRIAEADILDAGYDLSATVLKVGHHGSDTSTSYPFLREIMPKYAIISVGKDNTYGHPTDNTLSRLRDADVAVLRTDLLGTIICTSDGEEVTFETEKRPLNIQRYRTGLLVSECSAYITANKKDVFPNPRLRSIWRVLRKASCILFRLVDHAVLAVGFSVV